MVDLTCPNLLGLIEAEIKAGHSESRAFLAWVLKHIYRLDDGDAADAICDGTDDKGIDGIWVDESENCVDVFQSRLAQKPSRTIGDVALKEFVGTLSQFAEPIQIEAIAETTKNAELRGLLIAEEIADKIRNGYAARGVFVTNAQQDDNARNFDPEAKGLLVVDALAIDRMYIPAARPRSTRGEFSFDITGVDVAQFLLDQNTEVVMTATLASDLVRLDDLAGGELFESNVRQWLGRTKVNKDIEESIRDKGEHKNFLLYHNGVTMICSSVDLSQNGKVIVSGYLVINGCQSLTSLYNNSGALTPDLRIPTRFVRIPDDAALVDKITTNTNNQNGTKARDLKSNHPIQIRLQNEFAREFPERIFYEIGRGEHPNAPLVIDNELAGRLLLSFDLREPWSAHQTYRLFDDLYSRIFGRPSVTAQRIWGLYNIYEVVVEKLPKINNKRFASYALTKFFLVRLVAEALSTDPAGREFQRDPKAFIETPVKQERLRRAVARLLDDLIVDLNAELDERDNAGEPLDYKRELKSPTGVRDLAKSIIASYAKLVGRGRSPSFGADLASQNVVK